VSTCLITGATGAVGSTVLARALDEPGTRVIAIVRAASDDDARSRVAALLARRPDAVDRAHLERLTAVAGDVERPDLGLSPASLAHVHLACDRIVHCAGVVRMNLPIEQARSAAAGAARNVVALLVALRARGRTVKCDYVSTVGVAGRDVRLLPEAFVTTPRRFHNTYEQAKAESEEVIRGALDDGHAITVHRPSMVVGDSRTGWSGHVQVFHHLVEFLLGYRTRGLFPAFGAAQLDVVPADVVADALLWSSARFDTAGRVLHLCAGPGDALRLTRLRELVNDAAAREGLTVPRARTLPRWTFRAAAVVMRAVADARTRRALATLPVFLDYLASEQQFSNEATRRLLDDAGIELPPIERYLPRVLEFQLRERARAG
jgi:thioester reductase-like protein